MSTRLFAIALLALMPAAAFSQTAAPILSEVHTVATASTAVPVEHPFSISAAGTYQVTLTDLGAQLTPGAPLASVKMAVTSGSKLVGTPITAAGTLTFTTTGPGDYVVRVVGKPGTALGSGSIGIAVGTAAAPASLYSFSDTLALPGQALPNGEAVINDSFTVPSTGAYTVTLTDFQLPQALSQSTMIIIQEGAATPTVVLPDPSNSATVTLSQGVNYRVFAAGLADTSGGGLYGVTVASSGAPVYTKTQPVGTTTLAAATALPAGAHTALLTDIKFPAALTQLSGAVILSGQLVSNLTAGTAAAFTATASTYQVYVSGAAATASPGAGSYSLVVAPQSGSTEVNIARVVSAPGSTTKAYSFDTSIASAGTYSVTLTNFAFPASLTSLALAAIQGGQVIGTPLTAAGNLAVNAAAGPISFLVLAGADPSLGGVFDVNMTANGSSTLLFDQAQGVAGSSFIVVSRPVSVTAAGPYLVQATDLGFPANFTTMATLVSQGGTIAGNIYGSDQLSVTAQPGNYFVNLILQPAPADAAGTYALNVAQAPAPTVTLSSSAPSVANGGKVTLAWSSQNATACTASGSWSGTQATSGSVQSDALTSNATFTLTCTGAGGSANATVNVTVDQPASPSGHGGGGSLDLVVLGALAVGFGLRSLRRAHCRFSLAK